MFLKKLILKSQQTTKIIKNDPACKELKNQWKLTFTSLLFYQSPLILTELFQHNLRNVPYLTACYLYQVMMTLHFLNDVTNDAVSTQK